MKLCCFEIPKLENFEKRDFKILKTTVRELNETPVSKKNGQKPGNGDYSNISILKKVKTFDERNDIEENFKKSFIIEDVILRVLLF